LPGDTDTTGALWYVLQRMKTFPNASFDSYVRITFYSDFKTNCKRIGNNIIEDDGGGNWYMPADKCVKTDPPIDLTKPDNLYDSSWGSHYEAIKQTSYLVTLKPNDDYMNNQLNGRVQRAAERNFIVDGVIFGQAVQPHKLIKKSKSNPNKC